MQIVGDLLNHILAVHNPLDQIKFIDSECPSSHSVALLSEWVWHSFMLSDFTVLNIFASSLLCVCVCGGGRVYLL